MCQNKGGRDYACYIITISHSNIRVSVDRQGDCWFQVDKVHINIMNAHRHITKAPE